MKVGPVASADLRGLLEFSRRFPAYRPVLIGDESARVPTECAGVDAMTWRHFLLAGPPGISPESIA